MGLKEIMPEPLKMPYRKIRDWYRFSKGINLRASGSFGKAWTKFRLFHKVKPYTAVGVPRLEALYRLTKEIDRLGVDGDIVECGVWNGGTAGIIGSESEKSPRRRELWLFDSFQGLPQPKDVDGERAQTRGGAMVGDPAKVMQILGRVGVSSSRAHIVKGWFQDSFPTVSIARIALLHLDCDWYESVKLCLNTFYDRVQSGGFVALDDYGYYPGCKQAVDEFIAARGLEIELVEVDETGRYFQKP